MKKKDKIINTKCDVCGREFKIQLNSDDYQRYREGELAEDAMPYLTDDDFSVITCGICDKCL